MKNFGIKLALFINYFVFAILLNSVGILIQKSINVYGVDEVAASSLEAFKDLSIAVVSFFIGAFLPRLGYKKGILIALGLVLVGCISMYLGNSFPHVQILFLCTGISFAVVKVSVYALIGAVTDSQKGMNTLMSSIESFFMVGIASAYIIFPLFYSETDPNAWLKIYLLLAILIGITFLLVSFTGFGAVPQPEKSNIKADFSRMLSLLKLPMVFVFAFSAFMYVMTEQGIMSWLPTFNEKVLHLPEKLSVNMAVILALSIALGRYLSGQIVKKVNWVHILIPCLIAAALLVVFVLPLAQKISPRTVDSFSDIPMIAFVFPLIGLFLAPIYPLMNSNVLGAVDKSLHSPLAGLLTFFSAIGGTFGSRIVGYLFREIGGNKAFYFSLVPLILLIFLLYLLDKKIKERKARMST